MKKITDLFEKLAGHQLDAEEASNIKGGNLDSPDDLITILGIEYGGGDPPPFG